MLYTPEFQQEILQAPAFLGFINKNPLKILNAAASFYKNKAPFSEDSILGTKAREQLAKAFENHPDTISLISDFAVSAVNASHSTGPDTSLHNTNMMKSLVQIVSKPEVSDYFKEYKDHIANFIYDQYKYQGTTEAVKARLSNSHSLSDSQLNDIILALNKNNEGKQRPFNEISKKIQNQILDPKNPLLRLVNKSNNPDTAVMAKDIVKAYDAHLVEQDKKAKLIQGVIPILLSKSDDLTSASVVDGIQTYFANGDTKPIATEVLSILEKNKELREYLKSSTPAITELVMKSMSVPDIAQSHQLEHIKDIISDIIPPLLDSPQNLIKILSPAMDGDYETMGREVLSLFSTNDKFREAVADKDYNMRSLLDLAMHNSSLNDTLKSYNVEPEDATKLAEILPILLNTHPEHLHDALQYFSQGNYIDMAKEVLKIPADPAIAQYFSDNKAIFNKIIPGTIQNSELGGMLPPSFDAQKATQLIQGIAEHLTPEAVTQIQTLLKENNYIDLSKTILTILNQPEVKEILSNNKIALAEIAKPFVNTIVGQYAPGLITKQITAVVNNVIPHVIGNLDDLEWAMQPLKFGKPLSAMPVLINLAALSTSAVGQGAFEAIKYTGQRVVDATEATGNAADMAARVLENAAANVITTSAIAGGKVTEAIKATQTNLSNVASQAARLTEDAIASGLIASRSTAEKTVAAIANGAATLGEKAFEVIKNVVPQSTKVEPDVSAKTGELFYMAAAKPDSNVKQTKAPGSNNTLNTEEVKEEIFYDAREQTELAPVNPKTLNTNTNLPEELLHNPALGKAIEALTHNISSNTPSFSREDSAVSLNSTTGGKHQRRVSVKNGGWSRESEV